jgi:ankyrin repeat protein
VSWIDLHSAASAGDVKRVKELLEKGADPNARDENDNTPLHLAASWGHVGIVKLLLGHGANLNAQNKYGRTPLHKAAYWNRVDVVRLLLEHGANPNVQDIDGWTPLHDAAIWSHVEIVKLLLEHGANPNTQTIRGKTPLLHAAYWGRVDVVRLLLERGADPNAKDKYGDTPLHIAASGGRVDVVRLLLEHGADPTIKNKDGMTPLDVARAGGRHEVVSLIEEWLRRKPTVLPPPPPVDVDFVERLSGEAVQYALVSPSGPSFSVPEFGLSSCVLFTCGAFFCIYRCVRQDAAVAVKVFKDYRTDFERGIPFRFTKVPDSVLRELETVKALSHRNVLRLVAAWPEYGILAYEWGDGGSLRDQKLSGGDVLKALVHVAWGLRYLHSRGVVHGDLKPENVIVVRGVCKIADLASVRRLLSRLSGSRVGSCTFGFCAPEQVDLRLGAEARGRGFEDRVDVYQLANLALDLIGAETIDGSEWSRDKVEKAAKEAEAIGLSDFVKNALELEPWKRPTAEEAARRIAAEWRRRYS